MTKLKINKSISITDKIKLVEKIVDFTVDNYMVNSSFREISTVCFITEFYSDFEFDIALDEESKDLISSYDKLVDGIYYDEILKGINKFELESIYRMIQDEIDKRISIINIILEKMDKLSIDDMIEKLNTLDLKKFTEVNKVIKTLKGK